MLETLQVAFLAPSSTAGAISLEREKQTLELLVVTPISSLAIVIGKLFSALIYVWLLIAASIPLTAVVFVYGGVAPDDVLRGYIVLIVTALGFGAFGLLASSLVKRTQAATAISDLRRPVPEHRDAVHARLLAGHGLVGQRAAAPGRSRDAPPHVARLPEPVHRPGRRPVRDRDLVRRLVLDRIGRSCRTSNGIFPSGGPDQPVPLPAPVDRSAEWRLRRRR